MGIPRREPPDEACTKRVRLWEYTEVPGGGKVRGWLAGPPFWIQTHDLKKTRPCRSEISGGALACSVDHNVHPYTWRGYLPFYDEKFRPRGVWVSTPLREYLATLPPFAPILITRAKGDKCPLDVTHDDMRASRYQTHAARVWPADPSPTLLVLWKDLELTKWCRDQEGHGSVPTSGIYSDVIDAEIARSIGVGGDGGGNDNRLSSAERSERWVREQARKAPKPNGKH